MKRSEMVNLLKKSIIDHTNSHGYLDINAFIVSEILKDIEAAVPLTYDQEEPDSENI